MSNSVGVTFQNIDYIRHRLVAEGTLLFSSHRTDEKGNLVPYTKENSFTVQENEQGGFLIQAKSVLNNMEEHLILLSLHEETNYQVDRLM